ncbi:hypothetical protein K6119_09015 [Paracrocinitomix mangrovi]|uniref:hypothetical protein n=1 Tax=Paracrocinitomix mangrovi TaxID=2862509 RepID=UPI001C8EDED6|nr:hypothetical protein [Paracrocinitomix mangrovi]UKN03652.1 hypothetical protein K6119_09015 [Paracrocinitomix mangrovi]
MKIVLLFAVSLLTFSVSAQKFDVNKAFDFWVGEWEAHWTGANGKKFVSYNKVEKTLDGKVIQENFRDSVNHFYGTSVSVLSATDSLWHQTWVDNKGGYLELVGTVNKDLRVFQTRGEVKNNKIVMKRMLFYNITPNSFTWDWEISTDGGKTWKLNWQIKYIRIRKEK